MNIAKNLLKKIKIIPTELFIFLLAFLYRVPGLGYDFINNDAFHWKERGYAFGVALTKFDFAGTAVTYHPGVPLLWSQFVAIKIYSILDKVYYHGQLSPHDEFLINHAIQKYVLVFITSVLAAYAFHLLKRFIGEKLAIIATLLVLLDPFYLGLSRAIHTDVLISLFIFISVLWFYAGFQNQFTTKKELVLSGIFMGLAMVTKSSALFLLPFYTMWMGYAAWRDHPKSSWRIKLKPYLILLIAGIAAFIMVWPAMWVQPIQSLNLYLFKGVEGIALEEGHGHMWFGHETLDPGALFYPLVLLSRYSEVLILGFFFGIAVWLYKRKFADTKFLYLLSFVFLYLLMITLVSKKLDRYSLPIIFPMAVIAVYYLREFWSRKVLAVVFAGYILYRGLILYGLHPNYLAYYSPLIGGYDIGREIIEPKWLIGYDKVAAYFNNKQDPQKIKVAIADFDYLRPFANFEVVNIKVEGERDVADYFVLPVYRTERNAYYKSLYNLEKVTDEITVSGVAYYEIYRNKGRK